MLKSCAFGVLNSREYSHSVSFFYQELEKTENCFAEVLRLRHVEFERAFALHVFFLSRIRENRELFY